MAAVLQITDHSVGRNNSARTGTKWLFHKNCTYARKVILAGKSHYDEAVPALNVKINKPPMTVLSGEKIRVIIDISYPESVSMLGKEWNIVCLFSMDVPQEAAIGFLA